MELQLDILFGMCQFLISTGTPTPLTDVSAIPDTDSAVQ